jgi:hypothetical protein
MGSVGFVCGAQLQRDGTPGPRRFSIVLKAAAVLSLVLQEECIYRQVFTNMYMHAFCFMKKYFFVYHRAKTRISVMFLFLSILYHSLIILCIINSILVEK